MIAIVFIVGIVLWVIASAAMGEPAAHRRRQIRQRARLRHSLRRRP